jgi:thiamine biosynthesis protein ThiC
LSVQEHRSIKIRTFRKERSLKDNVRSMYGEYCAMKIVKDCINHCHKGKTT